MARVQFILNELRHLVPALPDWVGDGAVAASQSLGGRAVDGNPQAGSSVAARPLRSVAGIGDLECRDRRGEGVSDPTVLARFTAELTPEKLPTGTYPPEKIGSRSMAR